MIRFCDKEVWTIQEGQWSRLEMLSFFIRDHITDVLQLVDGENRHIGVTTYRKLLHNHDGISVCEKVFVTDERFWENAAGYFEENPEDMVPVVDMDGNIIAFCYDDDRRYSDFEMALTAFERMDRILIPIEQMYPKIQQVCIMDINEYSYRLYRILERHQIPVCVIGEKWEWFGVHPFVHYSDYPDYARLYVYAEGSGSLRGEKEHFSPGFDDLRSYGGSFWMIVDWANSNTWYVIEEQARRLSDLGVNVCKVIFPTAEQISYCTELEKDTIKHVCLLEKYIDDEIESEEVKKLYWKVWGKENCEIFKSYGQSVIPCEVALNGLRMVYYSQLYGRPTIWLVGPCVIEGYGLQRQQIVPAALQRMVGDEYNVATVGADARRFDEWYNIARKLTIYSKDVVVFVNWSIGIANRPEGNVIDLTEEYNKPGRRTYFAYLPLHVNADGAEMVARAIYNRYVNRLIAASTERLNGILDKKNTCIQKGELLSDHAKATLKIYLEGITRFGYHTVSQASQGGGNFDELQSIYPGPPVSGGICCGTGGFFICISGAGGQVLVLLCGPLRDGTAWNRASGQCVN